MRGQVILVTALIIAVAVSAVLILQTVATSAPGFGGVRAAYGVFSRDVSRAVEAIASYLDYVGAISLINFTENAASYALPALWFDAYGEPARYCKWLHVNKTLDMVNASMLFFVANRAPLGLSVELPQRPPPAESCKTLELRGGDFTVVKVAVVGLPNGTLGAVAESVKNYDGVERVVEKFFAVLPGSSVVASYRASMVMNVSLLALVNLNVTREFAISARVLVGVDANCPADVVCVNITVSRPYMWTARFEVLNRTVYVVNGRLHINYTQAAADVDLVNYTEHSAVYSIKPEGRLVEYVIKAYVANVPIYLARVTGTALSCQEAELRKLKNEWDVPIVLANVTDVSILDNPTSYRNVTRVDYRLNGGVTYWVIHRNGEIAFKENVCDGDGDVRQNLRMRGLYWVYP